MQGIISGASILGSFVGQLTSPDVEIHIRQIIYQPACTVVHLITA